MIAPARARHLRPRRRVCRSPELASIARFEQLTEKAREELRLIHNQRMSLQEVATSTGSNIEAVKKRMARARLLLDATSTRAAARRLVEHEAMLSPFGGNLGKGLHPPGRTADSPLDAEDEGREDADHHAATGFAEEGVAYASTAPRDHAWLRWSRSRPLAALVTACALLLLMVVFLSLVKLWTELLTQMGPHLGA